MRRQEVRRGPFPGQLRRQRAGPRGIPERDRPRGFFPNPAGGLPTGFNAQPSPFGVTFSGPAFSEPRLIGYAHAFEQATHHRQVFVSGTTATDANGAIVGSGDAYAQTRDFYVRGGIKTKVKVEHTK